MVVINMKMLLGFNINFMWIRIIMLEFNMLVELRFAIDIKIMAIHFRFIMEVINMFIMVVINKLFMEVNIVKEFMGLSMEFI